MARTMSVMMAARNKLKSRLMHAVRLPFRFVVSEAKILGMTEPMAAPIVR